MSSSDLSRKLGSLLLDVGASSTLVGLWPRFIEPRLLFTTEHEVFISGNRKLDGFKIVHLSDLHFHRRVSNHFLKRISKRVQEIGPDLILFTGDFICYSQLEDSARLLEFLNTLQATHGSFCVFGNHDYGAYVSRNRSGDYDVLHPASPLSSFLFSFHVLFKEKESLRGKVTLAAARTGHHPGLFELISQSPFTLLDNRTVQLPIGLNVVGLGDYGLGRFDPDAAFADYNPDLPGIILSHNPDTFPHLLRFPGQLVLSGHTHGEQIHLPMLPKLSRKLARLENPNYSRGKAFAEGKLLYVNRGLGGPKPFRLCAPPEIAVITLRSHE